MEGVRGEGGEEPGVVREQGISYISVNEMCQTDERRRCDGGGQLAGTWPQTRLSHIPYTYIYMYARLVLTTTHTHIHTHIHTSPEMASMSPT